MKHLTFAIGWSVLCTLPAAALPYNLIYNQNNGNLTIDTLDPNATLVTYSLASLQYLLQPQHHNRVLPFSDQNPRSHTNALIIIEYTTVPVTADQAGQIDPSITTASGRLFNLGNILPPNLSPEEYLDDGINAVLAGPYYHPTSTDQSLGINFNLVHVPEPGAIVLLGLGGLTFARRRRRF